jgi:hypothetical protein
VCSAIPSERLRFADNGFVRGNVRCLISTSLVREHNKIIGSDEIPCYRGI